MIKIEFIFACVCVSQTHYIHAANTHHKTKNFNCLLKHNEESVNILVSVANIISLSPVYLTLCSFPFSISSICLSMGLVTLAYNVSIGHSKGKTRHPKLFLAFNCFVLNATLYRVNLFNLINFRIAKRSEITKATSPASIASYRCLN